MGLAFPFVLLSMDARSASHVYVGWTSVGEGFKARWDVDERG